MNELINEALSLLDTEEPEVIEAGNPKKGMDDEALANRIESHKQGIDNFSDYTTLQALRAEANYAYNHDDLNYLPPTTDMSAVVANWMAPATDTLTTYLTRTFCADKDVVEFKPSNDELIPAAKQAQQLINHTLFKENNGYEVFNRCFKDAAVNHNGIIKLSWVEDIEEFDEEYEDIDDIQLQAIIAEKEAMGYTCEVVKSAEAEVAVVDEQGIAPLMATNNVTIRCTIEMGSPRFENVPPEEFNINTGAITLDGKHPLTRYVEHVKMIPASEFKMLFPEHEDEVPVNAGLEQDYWTEKQARHSFDDTYTTNFADGGLDTDWIELTECWVKADRDGDGREEWRHVFYAGNEILSDEKWYGNPPFYSFTFFPVVHKFYGLGVWTKIKSYQRAATGAMRGWLDTVNNANTPQFIFRERSVNLSDATRGRPGPIRGRKNYKTDDVTLLPKPQPASTTIEVIEYNRNMAVAEVGIDFQNGQISADIEKSGNDAEKTAMVVDNASAKVEGYCREFAENTLRPMIWDIAMMLVDHKDDYYVRMITEAYTPGQEFELAGNGVGATMQKTDLTAKVGLGRMNGRQKIAAVGSMVQLMKFFSEDQSAPLIIPQEAKLNMMYELAQGWGFDNPAGLFGSPAQVDAASQEWKMQQQVALQTQAMGAQAQQQQLQLQAMQLQGKSQTEQALAAAKIEREAEESNAKITKLLADADLARAKAEQIPQAQALDEATAVYDRDQQQ